MLKEGAYMWNQLLLIMIGFSAGIIIAGGEVGLLIGLSIIPRYARITHRTLADSRVVEMCKENYICWGCDVTSHYGYSFVVPSIRIDV